MSGSVNESDFPLISEYLIFLKSTNSHSVLKKLIKFLKNKFPSRKIAELRENGWRLKVVQI